MRVHFDLSPVVIDNLSANIPQVAHSAFVEFAIEQALIPSALIPGRIRQALARYPLKPITDLSDVGTSAENVGMPEFPGVRENARARDSASSKVHGIKSENVRKRRAATDLLELIPGDGPIPQAELFAKARLAGINEKYARQFLGALLAEKRILVRKIPRERAKSALGYLLAPAAKASAGHRQLGNCFG